MVVRRKKPIALQGCFIDWEKCFPENKYSPKQNNHAKDQ
jgi:hypothetical protein